MQIAVAFETVFVEFAQKQCLFNVFESPHVPQGGEAQAGAAPKEVTSAWLRQQQWLQKELQQNHLPPLLEDADLLEALVAVTGESISELNSNSALTGTSPEELLESGEESRVDAEQFAHLALTSFLRYAPGGHRSSLLETASAPSCKHGSL